VGTTSPDHPRTRRRLVLAGLLGAAVLTGGAGAAYAANTDSRAVETGYAVVVDGGAPAAEGSAATGAANDCPDGAAEGTGISLRVMAGGWS
jgi:hypothetical protein